MEIFGTEVDLDYNILEINLVPCQQKLTHVGAKSNRIN